MSARRWLSASLRAPCAARELGGASLAAAHCTNGEQSDEGETQAATWRGKKWERRWQGKSLRDDGSWWVLGTNGHAVGSLDREGRGKK